MYQTIVLGLGFLLVFGAGYLIKSMDTEGVVISKLTQTPVASTTVVASSTKTDFEGTYSCDQDSGCLNPSSLTILEGGEVTMRTIYGDGVEILEERGTWKSERNGGITVLFTGTDVVTYPVPHSLFIRYVSSTTLSGITFDNKVYPEWTRPVFTKQQREEE